MKLSEAIRLGIPAVREERDLYLSVGNNGDACGCALGTAMYAIGKRSMHDTPEADVEWPWLSTSIKSPASGWVSTVSSVISMLHYNHGWTRERIADWVATIEPKEQHDLLAQPDEAISPVPHSPCLITGGVDQQAGRVARLDRVDWAGGACGVGIVLSPFS